MIPQHPLFSPLTDIKAYPNYPPLLPGTRPFLSAVHIGPNVLNLSGGNLIAAYWMVTQDSSGNVTISKAI